DRGPGQQRDDLPGLRERDVHLPCDAPRWFGIRPVPARPRHVGGAGRQARPAGAGDAAEVARQAAAAPDPPPPDAAVSVCRACPRLVAWREEVATVRRAAFRDQTYWGAPVPGFGPPDARIAILGLAPAAHGGNRTGRVFTGDRSGDVLFASLHRVG